jgi:hypothetical protein
MEADVRTHLQSELQAKFAEAHAITESASAREVALLAKEADLAAKARESELARERLLAAERAKMQADADRFNASSSRQMRSPRSACASRLSRAIGNLSLRNQFERRHDVTEAQFLSARKRLIVKGLLRKGKGRGGAVMRTPDGLQTPAEHRRMER